MKLKDKQLKFTKEAFNICSGYLDLHNWDIKVKYIEGELIEGNRTAGQLMQTDYERNSVYIDIYMWFVADRWNISKDEIISLVMHELLHIFTIAPLRVFEYDKALKENLGTPLHISVVREMNIFNEQMNCRLEKIIMREFRKTDDYKDLIKKS